MLQLTEFIYKRYINKLQKISFNITIEDSKY